MLIKRDPFIQAARDEIYRAFRTNNKKWTTHLRPVDPKDIDYDIDDQLCVVQRADLLATLHQLQMHAVVKYSDPVPLNIRRGLRAEKQVHWAFAKGSGLNESDYESSSDDSTYYDSASSDSDPDNDFFSRERSLSEYVSGQCSLAFYLLKKMRHLD